MNIPANIEREHIVSAIAEISKNGIPPNRQARKHFVEHREKKFPVKYVISIANRYANGQELPPNIDNIVFFTSNEAINYLSSKGFEIVSI